jgi:hypothetical protein
MRLPCNGFRHEKERFQSNQLPDNKHGNGPGPSLI